MKSQKLLVIAAIVCLLVGASGAAYAADCSGGSIIKKIVNQIRCAAMTGAPKGVVVNAYGTNFINYPDAVKTLGGPDKMEIVSKKIPVGRFGEPEEVAHSAATLLDRRNMFATGMFIPMAGGYNIKSDTAASMAEE
jgi:3-oxoacyl-[acyl-carrier protein] reductase